MSQISSLKETPRALRKHIGILGRRNSGKSSLMNTLIGESFSVVSSTLGTTTDPVYKAMEMYPIGPCVLIDTAGFDDEGELGEKRVAKTKDIIERLDLAILLVTAEIGSLEKEKLWLECLKSKAVPTLLVINKIDLYSHRELFKQQLEKELQLKALEISVSQKENIDELKQAIIKKMPKDEEPSLTAHLVSKGDRVLLVAPQDLQAPKGRLILPQVQVMRDLLDHHAIVTIVTLNELEEALDSFNKPPNLIITDSQIFHEVYKLTPPQTKLTSFSVLMARQKGDLQTFITGASALDHLDTTKKILILEACTHNPLEGDIGRVKIPNLLKKRYGEDLVIEVISGQNFPEDLRGYSLVIHCAACMFNRRYMLSRIRACKEQNVPITNYGILISKLKGILEFISY